MQHVGVEFAHHFLRLVPVHASSALVPEQDFPVEILPNDGVFRGRFQDVADEIERFLRRAHDGTVEQSSLHASILWNTWICTRAGLRQVRQCRDPTAIENRHNRAYTSMEGENCTGPKSRTVLPSASWLRTLGRLNH